MHFLVSGNWVAFVVSPKEAASGKSLPEVRECILAWSFLDFSIFGVVRQH